MQSRTGGPTCGTRLGVAWVDAGTCALSRMLPPAPLEEVLEQADVEANNYAAYQFFASFFTDPLPKAFIGITSWGNSRPRCAARSNTARWTTGSFTLGSADATVAWAGGDK